jgi:ATP-dependent helicase/nuclease subunit A
VTGEKAVQVDAKTRRDQTLASDPDTTVWVSANAGSGKTHVLSQRVIRLLLKGVEPSRILCLTYTKTAAAQMVNRVFERLSAWTSLDDAALTASMLDIDGKEPDAAGLKSARSLFARALETPGGLQIQTIHAFCTTILKRFALEANIAGHFELLDDETNALYQRDAKRRVTIEAQRGGDEALTSAFESALEATGESGLDTLYDAVLSGPQRSAFQAFLAGLDRGDIKPSMLEAMAGIGPNETRGAILAAAWPLAALPEDLLRNLCRAAGGAKLKSIRAFGGLLADALVSVDAEDRFQILQETFLKADGAPRQASTFAKDPLTLVAADFETLFELAAAEVAETKDRLARRAMLDISRSAHVLLRRLMDIHRDMKRAGGFLDYDDLITATQRLLRRDLAAGWVHYKLDQGIDHVLVDEAQDTNPRQWDIVNTLTSDFFAGETATRQRRTLFVVGDEKQSIYSFQGARPDVFAATGRERGRAVRDAGLPFAPVEFPLSFRSTKEVLSAVDHVFDPGSGEPGLVPGGSYILHTANRQNQHGRVEVWEQIRAIAGEPEEDWTKPVDHAAAPAAQLAEQVAKTIHASIGKERNPATGKLVRAGDILVLVRKRDMFMHALSKELKDRKVPVAGADRLVLTSHIAILDLMAIARITLQPDDDLSLAALLRSPVFSLSDDELTGLASGRKGSVSLFSQLRARALGNSRLAAIVADLERWRGEADFVPVYEFFARVLGRDGVRKKLIGRLGEEAADIIDEFLSFALTSEKSGLHGLQTFVETLSDAAPEIKREASAGRDEVRIMTVHGAKGLESPYVFLVDPGSNPLGGHHEAPLMAVPLKAGNRSVEGFVWVPKKAFRNSAIEPLRAAISDTQLAEYKRLLYVGMTRAEDVLVVCGYGGARQTPVPTWIGMVRSALAGKPGSSEAKHPVTNTQHLVFKLGDTAFVDIDKEDAAPDAAAAAPLWLSQRLPPVILPPRPLTPSGAGLAVEDDSASSPRSPVLDPKEGNPSEAMRRGSAVHKLLEVLPGISTGQRAEAAQRYLAKALGGTPADANRLISNVFAILDDPRFAPVFASGSKPEVSIGGTVMIGGETRSISGKIDRLAVTGDCVLIVDYKTSRPAPKHQFDVPQSHIAQLALYRSVLQPLYPGRKVEAALVYTEGPHFIPLDEASLNAALEALAAS